MKTLAATALFLFAVGAAARSTAAEPLLWKIVTNAFLRVNDSGPPKEWTAFQIDKKHDRVLLQMSDRVLFIDANRRQVFDLALENFTRSGSDILWDPAQKPAKPLSASEWLVRDIGLAWRIKMHLDTEDRTLDLQLPHAASRP